MGNQTRDALIPANLPDPLIDCGPDYRGRVYHEFYVSQMRHGATGWVVLGRAIPGVGRDSYGPVVKICGSRGYHVRRPRGWNALPVRGWRTRREAQVVADRLNRQTPALQLAEG